RSASVVRDLLTRREAEVVSLGLRLGSDGHKKEGANGWLKRLQWQSGEGPIKSRLGWKSSSTQSLQRQARGAERGQRQPQEGRCQGVAEAPAVAEWRRPDQVAFGVEE